MVGNTDDTMMMIAQASVDEGEKDRAGGDEEANGIGRLLSDVLKRKPRYIGVYAPGDFASPLYRLVIPNEACERWGRGYMGAREEVVHESRGREGVDALVKALRELVGSGEEDAPIAIRHILNPSTNKDEGIRLIWPRTTAASKLARDKEAVDADAESDEAATDRSLSPLGSATPSGAEEMADWPRRDKMIQEGKTVQAEPDADAPNDFIHLQTQAKARAQGYTPTARFVQGYAPHMLVPFYSGDVHIPQPMIWGGHDRGLFIPLQIPAPMPPPYYSPVSALSTLSSDDPISPVRDVSPMRLDKAGEADKAAKVNKADGGLGGDAVEVREIEGDLMV